MEAFCARSPWRIYNSNESSRIWSAREEARRGFELDSTFFFPQMQFGWIDLEQGDVRAAIPELEKAAAMEAPPFATAYLGYAFGAAGERARAGDHGGT